MTAGIDDAVRSALAGELIVFPTDTVYGLGAHPDRPGAGARIFEAKGRPRKLQLPVLAASATAARGIAAFDARADALAEELWPGPLTVVLRRSARSAGWELGGDPRTIGVRVPGDPIARAVLDRTGPLATTSANRSGRPTPATCAEVEAALGPAVAVYLCAGARLASAPSAVVDLTAAAPRLLRAGALDRGLIERVLGSPVLEGSEGG